MVATAGEGARGQLAAQVEPSQASLTPRVRRPASASSCARDQAQGSGCSKLAYNRIKTGANSSAGLIQADQI